MRDRQERKKSAVWSYKLLRIGGTYQDLCGPWETVIKDTSCWVRHSSAHPPYASCPHLHSIGLLGFSGKLFGMLNGIMNEVLSDCKGAWVIHSLHTHSGFQCCASGIACWNTQLQTPSDSQETCFLTWMICWLQAGCDLFCSRAQMEEFSVLWNASLLLLKNSLLRPKPNFLFHKIWPASVR